MSGTALKACSLCIVLDSHREDTAAQLFSPFELLLLMANANCVH